MKRKGVKSSKASAAKAPNIVPTLVIGLVILALLIGAYFVFQLRPAGKAVAAVVSLDGKEEVTLPVGAEETIYPLRQSENLYYLSVLESSNALRIEVATADTFTEDTILIKDLLPLGEDLTLYLDDNTQSDMEIRYRETGKFILKNLLYAPTEQPPVNNPPVLAPIGDNAIEAGKTLTLTISATDTDNDHLTFNWLPGQSPAGSKLIDHEDGTATFTWTPTEAQVGANPVGFKVSDIKGGEDTETINIEVRKTPPAAGTQLEICDGKDNDGDGWIDVAASGEVIDMQGDKFPKPPVTAFCNTNDNCGVYGNVCGTGYFCKEIPDYQKGAMCVKKPQLTIDLISPEGSIIPPTGKASPTKTYTVKVTITPTAELPKDHLVIATINYGASQRSQFYETKSTLAAGNTELIQFTHEVPADAAEQLKVKAFVWNSWPSSLVAWEPLLDTAEATYETK